MMSYLIKLFFLMLMLISSNIYSDNIDKIIFSIEEDRYTTIDLKERISYLNILTNNENGLSNNEYLEDYISVLIFNKFAQEKNIKIKKEIIEDYLFNIINSYKEIYPDKYEKLNNNLLLDKGIIRLNIKYDYQRKIILEELLNNFHESFLNEKNDEIFDLYNINIKYFLFDSIYIKDLDRINNIINYENIENTKIIFNKELINYDFFDRKIDNLNKIDKLIRKSIKNNEVNFIIYKNNYFLVGKIFKKLKKNIDLKYSFYQIVLNPSSNLEEKIINCDNINYLKNLQNIKINSYKKMEIKKLNEIILNNLNLINDKILIKDDNVKSYIILCELNYNKKLTQKILLNEKISKKVQELSEEFISQKKQLYNFKIYE